MSYSTGFWNCGDPDSFNQLGSPLQEKFHLTFSKYLMEIYILGDNVKRKKKTKKKKKNSLKKCHQKNTRYSAGVQVVTVSSRHFLL